MDTGSLSQLPDPTHMHQVFLKKQQQDRVSDTRQLRIRYLGENKERRQKSANSEAYLLNTSFIKKNVLQIEMMEKLKQTQMRTAKLEHEK